VYEVPYFLLSLLFIGIGIWIDNNALRFKVNGDGEVPACQIFLIAGFFLFIRRNLYLPILEAISACQSIRLK
jgi:hypothetical protein